MHDDGADPRPQPAALLATVLSNLIRSALHHTDRGGVDVTQRKHGFSVVDTGAGIPATQRDRLFEPFARGDSTRGDGIGGLSLVARICAQQGWAITLADNPSGGCDFRIDLDRS